jgi:two-component system response regulator (stage 0 sporulation protein A)
MRLLVAILEENKAGKIEQCLHASPLAWDVISVRDGEEVLSWLVQERFDLLLLHELLPKLDGSSVLEALLERRMACPPRVLLLREAELCGKRPLHVDCVASILARPRQIAALLETLALKPVPALAAASRQVRLARIEEFLSTIELRSSMLEHQITATLYPACATVFSTTAAAVERCVRHAVEEVFTKGSICGIERCFGMTVDPERGKLTNRAFLVCAAEQLRAGLECADYSLARARSPKSMEMHHSPAAPTSV